MLQPLQDFKIGKPQIVAGLLLLAFLVQCLWVGDRSKLVDREYQYLVLNQQGVAPHWQVNSPATTLVAVLMLKLTVAIRSISPTAIKAALVVPPRWLLRLPFVMFGGWLGAALWWVTRRLFGDEGGYIALSLYCFSPAMITISSHIGPEIILAWSGFGLIYTAIGVAHTVYASPRKWIPRILILGTAIGICISTALWAFSWVLLALIFMVYLAPGQRQRVFIVLFSSLLIGLVVLGVF